MNIYFPPERANLAQNTQNQCMSNLTQSLLLLFYTITPNASKNHQTQNTQAQYMKSYRKFENNMDNLQTNVQNFPLNMRCTEIAITFQFTPNQVSSLQNS